MYRMRPLIRPLIFLSLLQIPLVQAVEKPELTGGGTNPFSVVRLHERVSYMVSLNFNNGRTVQQWRSVDCKKNTAQILYWDLLNEKGFTQARYYGNSYLRYGPAQDDKQMTAEDIRKICQLPIKEAQWEKLSATSSVGITDLVDVNSIQRTGDILSVRMGYDFADITWEPPYDAPLGLKIEHYLYNCKTHEGDAVSAMNFDSEGRVTDSLITADIVRRKSSFAIDANNVERFDRFCHLPPGKTFSAEGRFIPAINKPASKLMGPSMPDLSNNNPQWLTKFPLTNDIERQAQTLIKPWALPRFKQIRYTEVSDLGEIKVQLDAQPDGYLRKLEEYGIWTVQRLMLANQIQLKFTMSISSETTRINALQTNLHFPLVAGQHYEVKSEQIDSDKKISASTLSCNVTTGGDAHSISSEFDGKYLLVSCNETNEGQPDVMTKQAWLQDLNIFVPVAQKLGNKPERQVKLKNVSVTR